MKRSWAILLALLLIFGLTAAPAAADTGGKLIALTFDDGPGPYTARLLDGLAERNAKATFFLVGNRVNGYAATVKRAFAEGHQIANHSFNHANLAKLSADSAANQIKQTNANLAGILGDGLTYLVRAPYGSINDKVRTAAAAPLIQWSVDPQDWKDRDAEIVKNRVVNSASDGAIILLHDIHSTSVTGALAAIDALQKQGYEFVTVRELFRRRGVAMSSGTTYYSCKPNGTDLGPVTAPVFTESEADGRLQITLAAQPGAAVYYSLDGPEVYFGGTKYTGPFEVETPCTVWALAAYDLNGSRSPVAVREFTQPTTQPPLIQAADGLLTLSCPTPGAAIYYTLDGTPATPAATLYTEPVALAPGVIINACAAAPGCYASGSVRANYTARGNLFGDVYPGSWYYEAVDQAAAAGLLHGVADNCFAPQQQMTRAELLTALYRYAGEEATDAELAACPYSDASAASYYFDAACWAAARNITHIYAGDKLCPAEPLTRQELACLLTDFLAYRSVALPEAAAAPEFTDAAAIAPWAAEAVPRAAACGLMQGNETRAFMPAAVVTRAEGAAILLRLQNVEQNAAGAAVE